MPFKKRDKLANLLGLYLGSPIKCTLGRGILKCVCIYDEEMQTVIIEIEKEKYEISLTELDEYEFKLVLSGATTIPLSERIKSSGQSLIENSIKDALHSVDISILPEKYVEIKDNK